MDRPPGLVAPQIPMSLGYQRRLAVPQSAARREAGGGGGGLAAPPMSPRSPSYMATPSPPPLSPSPLGSPMSRQSSVQSGSLGVLSTPAIDADYTQPMATDELIDLGSPEPSPPPKVSDASTQTTKLYAAIDRLSKSCDDHLLRFRASKSSFEHRIFSEFPQIYTRIAELDHRAEQCTAELFATINEVQPSLKAHLDRMLEERRANVETMRERTTPWVDFLPDDDSEIDQPPDQKAVTGAAMVRRESGKIERVKGANASNVDADALAMIERWAEEVKMHLADEIGRLRTQLGEERRKAYMFYRLIALFSFCGVMLGMFFLIAKAGERVKMQRGLHHHGPRLSLDEP